MVQNLAQAGRSHFCPTHLLYPPSRSYIPLFSWVEAKSVAVGLSTSEPNGGGRSILEWRDLKGLRGCGSFHAGRHQGSVLLLLPIARLVNTVTRQSKISQCLQRSRRVVIGTETILHNFRLG